MKSIRIIGTPAGDGTDDVVYVGRLSIQTEQYEELRGLALNQDRCLREQAAEIERLRAAFLALAAAQDDFDRATECENVSPDAVARYSHAAWKMEVARRRFFRMAREEAEKSKGSKQRETKPLFKEAFFTDCGVPQGVTQVTRRRS